MKNIILLILLLLFFGCVSHKKTVVSKNVNQIEFDMIQFQKHCLQDSCSQLTDMNKKNVIKTVIQSELRDFIPDSIIRTDGKYFEVRIYKKGYNAKICDSLVHDCENRLPKLYKESYVQTPNPPCAIEGCFKRVILNSEFIIISVN